MLAVLQQTQKIALDARAAAVINNPAEKSGSALKFSKNCKLSANLRCRSRKGGSAPYEAWDPR
jgi:hypothetical protein